MLQAMKRMYPSEKVLLSMQNNSSYQAASPWQFMATVMESEGPTKKHQSCDKQSCILMQFTFWDFEIVKTTPARID